jgi:hypothetical protein
MLSWLQQGKIELREQSAVERIVAREKASMRQTATTLASDISPFENKPAGERSATVIVRRTREG